MTIKRLVKRTIRGLGFDAWRLGRYLLLMPLVADGDERAAGPDPLEIFVFEQRLAHILTRQEINCVLDVGANRGQYGLTLRRIGYRGHIISFEPVTEAFQALAAVASRDARWRVHQMALGGASGRADIHVTRGTMFSSFLLPTPYSIARFQDSAPVARTESVDVRRLDEMLPQVVGHIDRPRLFLKMDTQGYDLEVLAGTGADVDRMLGLQSEIAVVPLYCGMPTMLTALGVYQAAGFALSGLCPVSRDGDGVRILEYDCLMTRGLRTSASPL